MSEKQNIFESLKEDTKELDKMKNTIERLKEDLNILERTVSAISTNDFVNLLSKNNIIPLIVISILVGISISLSKEKGETFLNLLDSMNEVLQKFIKLID